MAKKSISSEEQIIDLLQKQLEIQLAKDGVPQNDIARIVGIHITKINSILKFYKSAKKR